MQLGTKIPDILMSKHEVFDIGIIRSQSRQNMGKRGLNGQFIRNFDLNIGSPCYLSEYWVGTRFTGTMIMRRIFYFHLPVGSAFFYLSYNGKKALNILTASVTPFLTGKNLNFLTLVAYNPCLSCGSLERFFRAFQDYGIALKTRMFINFMKKVG